MKYKLLDRNIAEFLTPLDAVLSTELRKSSGLDLPLLEIGVWKGGWIITQLINIENCVGFGVDPYPGLDQVKFEFNSSLEKFGLTKRYQHFNNLAELAGNIETLFSLVHIDGEHSEEALTLDLITSSKLLHKNGVIVIDDIFHADFPGVPSAAFKFLHNSSFCSFLITPNKMYICDKNRFDFYHNFVLNFLTEHRVTNYLGFPSGQWGETYKSDNSINGFISSISREV